MNHAFTTSNENGIPISVIQTQDFDRWCEELDEFVLNWVKATNFSAKPGTVCLIPDTIGELNEVLLGVSDPDDFWNFANACAKLPAQTYVLDEAMSPAQQHNAAIAWGLQCYQFVRYKDSDKTHPRLFLSDTMDHATIQATVDSIALVRNLINTPTEDMGPAELAKAAQNLASQFEASCEIIFGEQLLQENYPAVYTVGRASSQAPRLIDIRWGDESHPKVTLVGKGVCFDSGGLDIKPASGMLIMKKDMGGAAHVLGLAQMIMATDLPIRLRVLIPAVENAISGNAYRPGDVIATRKGLTVEIGNTDAEGRLILADALTEAASESPECIIDFATLTGAARVALGPSLPGLFCNDAAISAELMTASEQQQDPIWPMPLHKPYRKAIDGKIADLSNTGSMPLAGAITAALFLQEFVNDIPWVHYDVMAWNLSSTPGRPEGGEAMGLRATYQYLATRFGDY